METTTQSLTTSAQINHDDFEAPELVLIGHAKAVIQGFPGTGWDGPNGLTEPLFEFEPDATA